MADHPEYASEQFAKGLEVRRAVLGADYVDNSLARADDFNAAFQQMTTEIAWGMCWTRPGLDRKTRSMINLTMLSALNRGAELRLHLKAALTNGVTRDEIKEIRGFVRLKGDDKLLIVQAERVGRVQFHGTIFRADADVLVHHLLPLFGRARVQFARLDERIDEQVIGFARHDVQPVLDMLRVILVNVHGALRHGEE